MSKLMDQLRADHTNIYKLLCILENQIQRLQDGAGVEEPVQIIRECLDYLQQYPSICHHPREEVLIDMLLELLDKTDMEVSKKIREIKAEHKSIELLLPELYQQVHFAVESSYEGMIEQIRIFLDLYYHHVDVEDHLLFPLAMELFSEDDWRELDAHFSDISDPLFTAHDETENHFLRLFQMIKEHDQGKAKVAAN